jgi:hypothetical protein
MTVHLQDFRVTYSNFTNDYNPPILHEKDKLVPQDYPLYEKFAQLTKQEKEAGLLDNLQEHNHLRNWGKYLENSEYKLEDYQLISV